MEYRAESGFKAPITGYRNRFIVGLQRENGALNYKNQKFKTGVFEYKSVMWRCTQLNQACSKCMF